MDNEEAKFILRAYRPNGADATDVKFAGALGQAKGDPVLGKWFDRELAFDRSIAGKIRSMAPPAGLRDSILAGARASRYAPVWWRQPSVWALAACLILAAVSAVAWPALRARQAAARFADYAMQDTLHGQHANHGEGTNRLEAFLENNGTRVTEARMPVSYEELRATGCRTLEFAGTPVAELCFQRSGKWFHLYVMPKSGGSQPGPRFRSEDGAVAAQWTDEHHSYVIATTESLGALQQLL